MIFSGRTSRHEIWKFKRTQIDHHDEIYPPPLFLFDDDDDTDRSIQAHYTTSYYALSAQTSNRQNYLTSKTSGGNYALKQSRASSTTSFLTCCGITIDLSQKHINSPNTKSFIDESSIHRPIISKMSNRLLSKTSSCPQPSLSPTNSILRKQKTIGHRTNSTNRSVTRARAATVVHCSHNISSSTITTTLTNKPLALISTVNPLIHQSISKEKRQLPFETLSPITDICLTTIDDEKINITLTESPSIIQTNCDGLQLSVSF